MVLSEDVTKFRELIGKAPRVAVLLKSYPNIYLIEPKPFISIAYTDRHSGLLAWRVIALAV